MIEAKAIAIGAGTMLRRLRVKCARDNISGAAAAIAFFSLLAAFPGLGVVISIYGLVVDTTQIERHLTALAGFIPESVVKLLASDLEEFTRFQRHHLGLSMAVSLVLSLTSGRAAVATLMTSLNIVYGRKESRGVMRKFGLGLALTLGTLAFVAVSFALVAVAPLLIRSLPAAKPWREIIDAARWPILALMMICALAVLYRLAPHRGRLPYGWFNRGASLATGLWLIFSVAYSFYVSRVGAYDMVYGSVGSAVALLIWLYLSSLAILLGAEVDALRETREEPHG